MFMQWLVFAGINCIELRYGLKLSFEDKSVDCKVLCSMPAINLVLINSSSYLLYSIILCRILQKPLIAIPSGAIKQKSTSVRLLSKINKLKKTLENTCQRLFHKT